MKHLQLDLMKQPAGTALTTGNSVSISSYSADPITADVIRQCEGKIAWRPEHGAPHSHRLPSTSERAALERRLDQLAAMRRPAYMDREAQARVSAAIAEMVARFAVRPEDRAGIVALLTNDLEKLPAWAVEIACGKASRGEIAGLSRTFVPSSPEMFSLAKAELGAVQAEEARIRGVMALQPVAGPSDEERARVGAKFDALRARLRGDSTPEGETQEQWLARHGVSQEQFDAIPDAPARVEA